MSKESMMVFGYVRVSTENQLENYSIEEQTSRLKAYCAAKGWTLLHIYTDGGYSGGNTDRPALQEMLQAIRLNPVDAVIVYKLDRLSRSQKDTMSLIEDGFIANGTDFVSINENFDTSTPFGRAMIGILSVFAQLEKDQITERFTMGRIGRCKAGYFHGGGNSPTGYNYIDGELVVNEYEAIQIQEIFASFLSGKSINAIQRYLEKNYTTHWSAAKVRNVLKNTIYIGKVQFAGEEYPGVHQPLIDAATFEAASRLLGSSEREAKKTPAQKNPFRAGFILSGLVVCGRCGARYSANHGYYRCYSRAKSSRRFIKDPNCKNDNWEISALDQLISQQVDELILKPQVLDEVLKNAETKTAKVDKKALHTRVQEIDAQINKLIDLYQIGAIPMETITQRSNALSSERKRLQQAIQAPDEIPARELFLQALEAYRVGYQSGDTDKKRMLLSALIDHITIDGQSAQIAWRL